MADSATDAGRDPRYHTAAKHLTGYALFEKVYVFVASQRAWQRLLEPNRAAVRLAAADTVRYAATHAGLEDGVLARLCEEGVSVDVPTPAALADLARAERPVLTALDRDPAAGPILRLLLATPGTGPRVLVPPKECRS
jgi:TRAP-type C4-dicarboxylate transport system substrate-binding protein